MSKKQKNFYWFFTEMIQSVGTVGTSIRRITGSFLHLKKTIRRQEQENLINTYPAINSGLLNLLLPSTSSLAIISPARFFGSLSPLRSVSPTRSY